MVTTQRAEHRGFAATPETRPTVDALAAMLRCARMSRRAWGERARRVTPVLSFVNLTTLFGGFRHQIHKRRTFRPAP